MDVNVGSGRNVIRILIKDTLPGPNLCKFFAIIVMSYISKGTVVHNRIASNECVST
jgi:hypothetical protein